MRQRDVTHQDFNLERGFSLMEVLISMAVFTLVVFAIFSTFESGAGTYAKGDMKADIHQNTRGSMELMVREIRLAGYFPENFPFIMPAGPPTGCVGPPFVGISNAAATTITICSDIDGDNSSEMVVYTWFGDTDGDNIVDPGENEIRRQVTDDTGLQPQEVIAFNISAFLFSYSDRLNNAIAPPGDCSVIGNATAPCDIGRVNIAMTGSEPVSQSAPIGGRSPSPFATRVRNYQLGTDVRPRNLGL
jgi:prepilin-type N-terminal cleavage/methylation domain-containing protein